MKAYEVTITFAVLIEDDTEEDDLEEALQNAIRDTGLGYYDYDLDDYHERKGPIYGA